jgi:hypothetical protein
MARLLLERDARRQHEGSGIDEPLIMIVREDAMTPKAWVAESSQDSALGRQWQELAFEPHPWPLAVGDLDAG